MSESHHHHHHDHHLAPGNVDWDEMGNELEFEGESLSPHIGNAVAWAREHGSPSRIVDIGSGPGVAAVRFATEFPGAKVTAIDGSAGLLERACQRAERAGVAARFATMTIDLSSADSDAALTVAVAGADLVWVSMVLHHLPNSAHVLSVVRAAMAPGGMLIVAEFGSPLRVLPADTEVEPAGLFGRIDRATAHSLAEHVGGGHTHTHADWPGLLTEAGFSNLGTRESVFSVDAPLEPIHREWVLAHLRRVRMMASERLDAADVAVIDDLLDPSSTTGIATRPDALIRTSRQLYAANA